MEQKDRPQMSEQRAAEQYDTADVEGAPIDAPAVGDEAPEVPLTMEERLALKNEMEQKCKDLTELLRKCQADEQDMKEMVLEFIIRDVEEQNAAADICTRVEAHQAEKLSDPAYIRWAAAHRKGEFACDGAVGGAAAAFASGLDEAPFRRDGSDASADLPTAWLRGLRASHHDHDQLQQQPPVVAGVSKSELAEQPRGVRQSSRAFTITAAAGAPVAVFGQAAPFLASWKRERPAVVDDVRRLCACVLAEAKLGLVEADGEGFIWFVNGQPMLALAEELVCDPPFINALARSIKTSYASAPTPEQLYVLWWHAIVDAVASRSSPSSSSITAGAGSEEDTAVETLLRHPNLCATALRQDEADVVCAVPASAVRASVVARAFVIRGELRAIEVLSPAIDVVGVLFGDDNESFLRVASQAARTALARMPSLVSAGTKSVAITMLVPQPHQQQQPSRPGLKGMGEGNAATAVVVVDVQQVAPQLPYQWQLRWGDVCTLAQSATTRNDEGDAQGKSAGSEAVVELKAARQKVIQLEPMDSLTRVWFPILNSLHSMSLHVEESAKQSLRSQLPKSMWRALLPRLTLGAVVAATAVVAGAMMWARRRW